MELDASHVERIAQWNAEMFGRWLRQGLSNWHHTGEKKAFSPVHMYIQSHVDITYSLYDLGRALDIPAQEEMCAGIAQALGDAEDVRSARSLLNLAVLMKARKALSTIPDVVRRFAREKPPQAERFLVACFFTVTKLYSSACSDEEQRHARNSLLTIAESPAFPSPMSGIVLTSLCKIRPETLNEYLNAMSTPLKQAYGDGGEAGKIPPNRPGEPLDPEALLDSRREKFIAELRRVLMNDEILKSALNNRHMQQGNAFGLNWWQRLIMDSLDPVPEAPASDRHPDTPEPMPNTRISAAFKATFWADAEDIEAENSRLEKMNAEIGMAVFNPSAPFYEQESSHQDDKWEEVDESNMGDIWARLATRPA